MRASRVFLAIVFALAAAGAASQPVKIRAAYVVPVGDWPSLFFQKSGIARHDGKSYTFESVHFQGTPQIMTALANGEIEVAGLAFASLAIAVQNAGMNDLRVVAGGFRDGMPGYLSGEYYVLKDGPIHAVKDLKGKVLAVNVAGSAVDIVMRAMLRKHGLDDRRDANFIETAFPNMKATLFAKRADAIATVSQFSLDPELRAKGRVLFTQRDAMDGPTQMTLLVVREGFLKKNRAAMVDFMEDAIRSVRWYIDPKNHDEVVQIAARVSKRPAASFDKWLFRKAGQDGDYYHDENILPDLKTLQANIDLQHKLGLVKASLNVAQHSDLTIIRDAASRIK